MAKKPLICVNLISSLDRIELCRFDPHKNKFLVLDSVEFLFDPATRELLDDKEQLVSGIRTLYTRNKIPFKTPSALVVPSFFTRQYQMPEGIEDEDIKPILIAEAERFYVFKKIDPDVAYIELQGQDLLYTAYPKTALEEIKEIFKQLKIPLVTVDCSYTATLRGLVSMGVVREEVTTKADWGLMIVSDFNVFLAVIQGQRIIKATEIPLSIQNTEISALLSEIANDFKEFFGYEVLNRLIVANNSLKIPTDPMTQALGFGGQIDVFEQNINSLASLGSPEAALPCSLESVGGSLAKMFEQIPVLELLEWRDKKSKSSAQGVTLASIIRWAAIALGLLVFGLQYGVGSFIDMQQKQAEETSAKLQAETTAALNALSVMPVVKQKLFILQAKDQNIRTNNLLVKLLQATPPDAWFKNIDVASQPDLKTFKLKIEGEALTSEPLNTLVSELNAQLKTSSVVPNVVPAQKESARYFQFTLESAAAPAPGSPGAAAPPPPAGSIVTPNSAPETATPVTSGGSP